MTLNKWCSIRHQQHLSEQLAKQLIPDIVNKHRTRFQLPIWEMKLTKRWVADQETPNFTFDVKSTELHPFETNLETMGSKSTDVVNGTEPPEYVTLVSCDGFEFQVLRSCATVAGAIRRMLDPSSTLHNKAINGTANICQATLPKRVKIDAFSNL